MLIKTEEAKQRSYKMGFHYYFIVKNKVLW